MYTLKELKIWTKRFGYEFTKIDEPREYRWTKLESDPIVSGSASSLSKLVTQIYNHMTDNKHVEHQEKYRKMKEEQEYKGLS